jgi:hypothetical protein
MTRQLIFREQFRQKNDGSLGINKVFDQFLEDFKTDRDPRVKLEAAKNDLEEGRTN